MQQTTTEAPRAIRKPRVLELTGLSNATLYRLIAKGQFPAPVKLSERISAWDEKAVNDWLAAKFGCAQGE